MEAAGAGAGLLSLRMGATALAQQLSAQPNRLSIVIVQVRMHAFLNKKLPHTICSACCSVVVHFVWLLMRRCHAWDNVVAVPYCFLVTGAGLFIQYPTLLIK